MTVQELMLKLAFYEPEATVYVWSNESQTTAMSAVETGPEAGFSLSFSDDLPMVVLS